MRTGLAVPPETGKSSDVPAGPLEGAQAERIRIASFAFRGQTPAEMKAAIHVIVLFALCFFSGCATPGSSYASAHPGLSPAHRQILIAGRIPSGDTVAGMTHEQVTIAMGRAPSTFDKIDGQDVWIYVRSKSAELNVRDDFGYTSGSSFSSHRNFTKPEDIGPRADPKVKTTIFFQGDRATRAQVIEERQ